MLTSKNTAEHYYLVVTCRDKNHTTYNLSYRAPVDNQQVILVAESSAKARIKEDEPVKQDVVIDTKQVASICRADLNRASELLDGVKVVEGLLTEPIAEKDSFLYSISFTAASDLGTAILHRADCRVSKAGIPTTRIALVKDGALARCRDTLRVQSILIGRSTIIDDSIEQLPASEGRYSFRLPFDVRVGGQQKVRYTAHCSLDTDGHVELSMKLDKEAVKKACLQKVELKAKNMQGFKLLTGKIKPMIEKTHRGEVVGYSIHIPFDARSQTGKKLYYSALCDVDSKGRSEISLTARKP